MTHTITTRDLAELVSAIEVASHPLADYATIQRRLTAARTILNRVLDANITCLEYTQMKGAS